MPRSKARTVLDVAKRAGVSPATVSRAFNRPELLDPQTLTRVLREAKKLKFAPNALARGLVTGRSGIAALIVPDITDPFFAQFAASVERALRPEGIMLTLCHTSEQQDEEEHLTRLLEQLHVDGFVVSSEAPNDASPSPLDRSRIPSVMVERLPRKGSADTVILDKSSIDSLIEYLVVLGHRRIALVPGHLGTYGGREFFQAVKTALEKRGLDLPDEYVVAGDFKFEKSREAAAILLRQARPPTVVLVGSDRMTLGFVAGLEEHGVRIPQDLSLATFSTHLIDSFLHLRVTGCLASIDEIGTEAARLLINRICNPQSPTLHATVPAPFVIRDSCRSISE